MKALFARGSHGPVAKTLFVSAGVAGVIALAGLAMPAATREAVLAPAIAAAQSLSSVIGNRSPGTRAEGALAKSKKRLATPRKRLAKRVPVVPDTGVRRRLAPRGPEPLRIFDDEVFARDVPFDAFPAPDIARTDAIGPSFTVPNPRAGSPFILLTSAAASSSGGGGGIGPGDGGSSSSSGGDTGSTGGSTGSTGGGSGSSGSTGGSTGGDGSTSSGGSASSGSSSGGASSTGGDNTSTGSTGSTGSSGSTGSTSTSSGSTGSTSSTSSTSSGSSGDVSSTGGFSSTSTGSSTGGTTSTGGSGSSGGTTPGPVPEPGTWLMMIAGFGLIGAMLRRRTRAASPAA